MPAPRPIQYDPRQHSAAHTQTYLFHQLIPYIGNKRKLLDLLQEAIRCTRPPRGALFLDLFASSGVVSRLAKVMRMRVVSNDWEPYARAINTCYIACNHPPEFAALGGYPAAIATLNRLPPREDWVTRNLCPANDADCDPGRERMFYMRKNGMRIDAIRSQVAAWRDVGTIDANEEACLLAPLLYQGCYRSNTSGVFKAYHAGWGGNTGTALYRIATDLCMTPAAFLDNHQSNEVYADDALALARSLRGRGAHIAYVDPPYNQHPYGSNYHVLNSLALWDRPDVPADLRRGAKSAIRTDWRECRRSAYNHRADASRAYVDLLDALDARFVLTSYSTDGTIPLPDLVAANVERGSVRPFVRAYKRYRVSSQRFSAKPLNVEFVLVLDRGRRANGSADAIVSRILDSERDALRAHPESPPLQSLAK